uniref:General transcription factor IIH subunit 4 n=1 Tax=Phaeomonas parva TaxID=124430 RepID=A0A7S1TPD0_9STRA
MAAMAAARPKLGLETLFTHTTASLDRLYTSRWVCRAVFAQLSGTARAVIMRLLYVDCAEATVRKWAADTEEARRAFEDALGALKALRVLRVVVGGEDGGRVAMMTLSPSFRLGLSAALTSACQVPWQGPEYKLQADHETTMNDIVSHMHDCWNNVLRFLVEEDKAAVPLSDSMRALVESERVDLLKKNDKNKMELTQKGYEFMLKGVYMQVWEFITVYLDTLSGSESGIEEREQVLDFLYHLSYCRVGDAYHRNALTGAQRSLLLKFKDLGLVYMRKKKSKRFYPTPLGVHLMAGGDGAAAAVAAAGEDPMAGEGSTKDMRIIVQTNLKVIAYTTSRLHASMLGMFSEVHMRLPNMVLAELTRRSVKKAVSIGVNAERIKNFLVSHAHPVVAAKDVIIPENVSDQIDLWEGESKRVKFDAAVLVNLRSESLTEADFSVLVADVRKVEEAEGNRIMLWTSAVKQLIVVHPGREGVVQQLLEQHRNDNVVVLH